MASGGLARAVSQVVPWNLSLALSHSGNPSRGLGSALTLWGRVLPVRLGTKVAFK